MSVATMPSRNKAIDEVMTRSRSCSVRQSMRKRKTASSMRSVLTGTRKIEIDVT